MGPGPAVVVSRATTFEFAADDAADPRFGIVGSVRGGGLTFAVKARHLTTGARGAISGRAFFVSMMSHFFMGRGTLVTHIHGDWSSADPEMASNVSSFNAGTAAGATDEVAAADTFTGRGAAAWGFTVVKNVRALPPGARGSYTDVSAEFHPGNVGSGP